MAKRHMEAVWGIKDDAVGTVAKDTSYICKAMLSCASNGTFRLCSAEEVANEVDTAFATSTDARDGLAPLAAWYAQGSLPEELVRAASRASYRAVEPDKPDCGEGDATKQPCRCSDQETFRASLPDVLCKLGAGPVKEEISVGACSVRVDDDRKQLIVVRRSD